jgi:hypothetical protein
MNDLACNAATHNSVRTQATRAHWADEEAAHDACVYAASSQFVDGGGQRSNTARQTWASLSP